LARIGKSEKRCRASQRQPLKILAELWLLNRQDFVGSGTPLTVSFLKDDQFPLSKSLSPMKFLDVVKQNDELVAGKHNLKKAKR